MNQFRTVLIEKTDVHRLRLSIDAARMVMLLRVEVPPGLLLMGVNFGSRHHTAALGSGGGLDEYQCTPPHRRPVAVQKNLKGRIWGARGEC